MKFSLLSLATAVFMLIPRPANAQFDADQLGGWYVYQWTVNPNARGFGLQGDIQHRNWDLGGDVEQLLGRAGVNWTPQGSAIKYTFGYAYIHSATFGPGDSGTQEQRLYQEALLPHKIAQRLYFTHRVRFEQREVENQDLRTRLRYFLGLNYPLNQDTLGSGAVYLSFSNEYFLNLERGTGRGRSVDYFDRNRAYAGVGYSVNDKLRIQAGYMHQQLDESSKRQLQLNLIHTF
jgi:hypothetical protein